MSACLAMRLRTKSRTVGLPELADTISSNVRRRSQLRVSTMKLQDGAWEIYMPGAVEEPK